MAKQETLKNVQGMLLYACIQSPVENYDKDGDEWKVSVVVDEETAEQWDATFKKQKAKMVKRKAFESTYKVAPPTDDDVFYVVTLKKPTTDSKGNELDEKFHPKAFLKLDNGKRKDITQTSLIGNGSMGVVSIYVIENDKFGTSARLNNVLVTDLVEYIGGEAGSEFDDMTDGEEDEFEDEPAPKKRKAASKPVEEEFDDVDDEPAPKRRKPAAKPADDEGEQEEKPKARRKASAPPPPKEDAEEAAGEEDAPWED